MYVWCVIGEEESVDFEHMLTPILVVRMSNLKGIGGSLHIIFLFIFVHIVFLFPKHVII